MNAVTTVLELAIGDRLKRAKLAVEDTKRYATFPSSVPYWPELFSKSQKNSQML